MKHYNYLHQYSFQKNYSDRENIEVQILVEISNLGSTEFKKSLFIKRTTVYGSVCTSVNKNINRFPQNWQQTYIRTRYNQANIEAQEGLKKFENQFTFWPDNFQKKAEFVYMIKNGFSNFDQIWIRKFGPQGFLQHDFKRISLNIVIGTLYKYEHV